MSSDTTKIVVAGIVGLAVGGFVGYLVTQRALRAMFEEELDIEVKKVKEFYKGKYGEEDYFSKVTPIHKSKNREEPEVPEVVDAETIMKDRGYISEEDEVVEAQVEVETTKTKREVPPLMDPTPIDYNSQEFKDRVASRSPEEPYIITVDEFMDDYPEFDKTCLTYFEADDILCDTRDQPIPDIAETIGLDSLDNFGLYSKDKNIVYVRNERISSDFEIAYDPGSYLESIAGFKQFEEDRRISKMRDREDD